MTLLLTTVKLQSQWEAYM